MEITREKAVELLNSTDINVLYSFIYDYCIFHKKDPNITNIFIRALIELGMIKSLVNSTVLKLVENNNLLIDKLVDLKSNTIIKYI